MKLIKITDTGLMKFENMTAVAGNTLAGMMDIRHEQIMRTINKVIKSEEKRKKDNLTSGGIFSAIFRPHEYKDSMNRTRKTFLMNEDALYLVIANSQGQKAHELKVWFKSEFNKMRDERKMRDLLKVKHSSYTDSIDTLQKMLKEEGSGASGHIFSNTQLQVNKAVTGRPTPRGIENYRDILTEAETNNIWRVENISYVAVDHWLEMGLTGREIKDNLQDFLKGDAVELFISRTA